MEQGVAVAAPRVHADQVVERLLEGVVLHGVQLRLDFGQEERQVDDDAERAVEVGQIAFGGGQFGQLLRPAADLAHGPVQHGHDVGERERRDVGRTALRGHQAADLFSTNIYINFGHFKHTYIKILYK